MGACELHERMSLDLSSFLVAQDINSASWMVRMYYKHRLFMGACCISCEVLYLSVCPLHPVCQAPTACRPTISSKRTMNACSTP